MVKSDQKENPLIGEIIPVSETFPNIEQIVDSLHSKEFLDLSRRKRFKKINQILCKLIQDAPPQSFLLSAVLDFIHRINHAKVLKEPFNMVSFEFWLNNFSDFSEKDNYEIRAKIAGKYLPRSDYQSLFPVGMNRTYAGSHFVIAHLSPDIDTMIASFWGWLDAFSARIGTALHQWFLPSGPPDSPFTSIFQKIIGESLFKLIPRMTTSLTLTSMDLITQRGLIKLPGTTLINDLLDQEYADKCIILVNEEGNYIGDWLPSDIELARQIIIPFKSCLHWFENNLHTNLISLFAKKNLSVKDLPLFHSVVFETQFKDCDPALEFNEKQKNNLSSFFKIIFGIDNGLNATFKDLSRVLKKHSLVKLADFQNEIEQLAHSEVFDNDGKLKEIRPELFKYLEKIIFKLDQAISEVRNYVERMDVMLKIKYDVLGIPQNYLTVHSDVEEMRNKMDHHDFLTVVIHEMGDALFPIGIVRSADLKRSALGTVSFRDFCNFEEVKMSSGLEVISVIDHHKNTLSTASVPLAIIADVQSCNVLLAEQAFQLNDKYSLGGMTLTQIENQLKSVAHSTTQLKMRLLQRHLATQNEGPYYIHPQREYSEYYCFLQAILDDTDLLTKVSDRDLECITQLLNRLKSLAVKQEVEIISLNDIPRDKDFIKTASKRILQQPDMYSVYRHVYSLREKSVEENLELCVKGRDSNIFLDAKEQNGCARVGQTKLFTLNFPYYLKHAMQMRKVWLDKSKEVVHDHPEIDLHIHMISTIASAEEVYKNQIGPYPHQDELWFWIPPTQLAQTHLSSFLAGFQFAVRNVLKEYSLEFFGNELPEFADIFNQHFPQIKPKFTKESTLGDTIAVLRFEAGKLNSRKSMITPFLPR